MKIGIFGSGAIGCAIAHDIYKVYPQIIYLCAKGNRYEKLKKGIVVNNKHYDIKVTDNLKMDYLIVCVKNYDLIGALPDIRTFISDDTVILPLLNGIVAHDIIKEYFPNNQVLWGMIRIEANKTEKGINASRVTEIAFGNEFNYEIDLKLKALKEIFDGANIINNIYEDMKRAVWRKFMLNIGINQVSALTNSTYKDMNHPLLRDLLYKLFLEVVELAKYENVNITEEDARFMIDDLAIRCSDRVTSLTEDINNKRKNEVDYFGKTVLDLAKKHNIKTPYNEVMYNCLKAITDNYLNK